MTTQRGNFFPGPALGPARPRPADLFTQTSITFLVPIRANAEDGGEAFTWEDWTWLESRLFDLAGGLSLDGVTKGKWRDQDGTVYEDESRRYKTAIEPGKLAEFTRFLAEVKVRFKQKAIYAERATQAVAFI